MTDEEEAERSLNNQQLGDVTRKRMLKVNPNFRGTDVIENLAILPP